MPLHELPLERRTLHGHFSRELEPVLSVEPGDAVRFSTLQSGWAVGAQGDGEVSGTAIEAPLERAQLTLDLRDDLELRMPVVRTADAWRHDALGSG